MRYVKFSALFIGILMITFSAMADLKKAAASAQQAANNAVASVTAQIGAPISLITNVPLAEGFAQWQQWLQPGSNTAGVNEAKLVPDPTYGNVAQFSRTQGGADGGAAGIFQSLAATVFKARIHVEITGKVINQQGGNIANTQPQWFPEGAIQVRVKYLASDNQPKEWFHGFYTGTIANADTANFTKVNQNEWVTYKSPNLRALPGGISKITEIKVYGFGWNFIGQVAKISLYTSN